MRSISGLRGASGVFASCLPAAGSKRPPFGRRELAVGADHVDALAFEIGVQLRDLLLGDLHLFQRGGDLLERQETALLTFGNKRTELVDLRDGRVARQQCVCLCCQTLIFRDELLIPNASLASCHARRSCLYVWVEEFPLRGLDRVGLGIKVLIRCSAGGCPVPSTAFVARNPGCALGKPWGVRAVFWASVWTNGPLPLPIWTNIRVLPPSSRTSRPAFPASRSRSPESASPASKRSSASSRTEPSSCSTRSSSASSTSARARRARTCRASRRSSTTRSAR